MINLPRRAALTAQVIVRFRAVPFDWSNASCIHLARAQAEAMGYLPPSIPKLRSAIGAKRVLKRMGFNGVEALLDSMFERIAPAAALVGDLVALPGQGGLAAVAIADGVGNVIGWHEGADRLTAITFAQADMLAAWRL